MNLIFRPLPLLLLLPPPRCRRLPGRSLSLASSTPTSPTFFRTSFVQSRSRKIPSVFRPVRLADTHRRASLSPLSNSPLRVVQLSYSIPSTGIDTAVATTLSLQISSFCTRASDFSPRFPVSRAQPLLVRPISSLTRDDLGPPCTLPPRSIHLF